MKILFTADLHIRVGQKNIPRDWALKQYEIMFSEFDRVFNEYNCDLEVHGGDIFDKVPTMEELSLYIGYLWQDVERKRVIYDGNHEATKKGKTFLEYLKNMIPKQTKLIYEMQSILLGTMPIDVLPYADLHKLKDMPANSSTLFTHVRGEIPPHVKPEVDLDLFDKWDVVFAGDLHSHKNTQRNIVYPGSPRTVTFHRNEVELGVLVFEAHNPKDWEWVKIEVPQLIRKTVDNPDDMVKTEFHHTIYELTGNILELSKVSKDSDLLDKKIVQNESLASLDLVNLSLEEEVEKYLRDVIKLSDPEINEVMEVYYANT